MKLSMWIFADWLKEYDPEVNIMDGGLNIETARLFSSNFNPEKNCLYIGRIGDLFTGGNDNVICTHKNDIIMLPTSDLDEIMNQILNAFEFYQSWNVRILEAISSDIRPAEFIAIANEVIHEPIYLLDANQYAIALSSGYQKGSVNYLWDQMLDHGSADYSFLKQLDDAYPEHRTNRGLYYFAAPFIEAHSYNYNMFLENNWIGLCSMIERNAPLPRHTADQFHIFCQNMELWYVTHSQELRSLMIDSLFRDMLKGNDTTSDTFIRQFQLRFGEKPCRYYLMTLSTPADYSLLIGHVSKEINLSFPDCLSIIYEERICILLADKKDLVSRGFPELSALLSRSGYYGGCSTSFSDLKEIPRCFKEAAFVTEHMPAIPGSLASFSDYALDYALQMIRANSSQSLIHPAVTELIEYDRQHHTSFAETLYVYLKKERSQSKTAAALNLHRNSLSYRLQRIREILPADLDDDNVRLQIFLSFLFWRQGDGSPFILLNQ